MGIAQEVELYLREPNPSTIAPLSAATDASFTNQTPLPRRLNYRWWLVVTIYTFGLLIGQAGATLLGRFYFNNGGKSKWLATFVQSAGFPIVIPFLLFFSPSSISNPSNNTKTTSLSIPCLALIYLMLGLLVSGDNLMYSYGLLYLPVSTYSLLCATQLAFNAVFSYFLNSLKFTSFILNSIVLITISAIILAIHTESNTPSTVSTGKYIIGFLCTIVASALYSLLLSLTQIFFEKVVKRNTIWMILEMQIYPAMVATCVCVIGLFASGDWKTLKGEMEEFKSGKVSYVMTVVWTAVLWLVFSVSCLGLIYEASSLLSNVISTVGLPIIPILAVVFFHDNMDGMKIVAMVLAIWGFVSYIYQHYLDDAKSHSTATNASESLA